MNMRTLTKLFPLLLMSLLLTDCEKTESVIFQVNELEVRPSNAFKDKLKTEEQFVSILYANLFQSALSASELVEIVEVIYAFGDKPLIHEVLISNFMNTGQVVLPSNEEMRSDIEGFIRETYHRFLVREPAEAELQWFLNYIENNPGVTPELVYFAFALSNEYLYY